MFGENADIQTDRARSTSILKPPPRSMRGFKSSKFGCPRRVSFMPIHFRAYDVNPCLGVDGQLLKIPMDSLKNENENVPLFANLI